MGTTPLGDEDFQDSGLFDAIVQARGAGGGGGGFEQESTDLLSSIIRIGLAVGEAASVAIATPIIGSAVAAAAGAAALPGAVTTLAGAAARAAPAALRGDVTGALLAGGTALVPVAPAFVQPIARIGLRAAGGDIVGAISEATPFALPGAIQPLVPIGLAAARGDVLGAAAGAAGLVGFRPEEFARSLLPSFGGVALPFSIGSFATAVATQVGTTALGAIGGAVRGAIGEASPVTALIGAGLGGLLGAESAIQPFREQPSFVGKSFGQPSAGTGAAGGMDAARRSIQAMGGSGLPGEVGSPFSTAAPFSFSAPLTSTRQPTSLGMLTSGGEFRGARTPFPPGWVPAGGGTGGGVMTAGSLTSALLRQAKINVPGITLKMIRQLVLRVGIAAVAQFIGETVDQVLFLFTRGMRRHRRRGITWRQLSNAKRVSHILGSMSRQFHPARARAPYRIQPARRRRRR